VDGLLTRVARGRGALDVAIGDGLEQLTRGDRLLRLGYSGLGDFAVARLGMSGGAARRMARLARALHDRPVLLAAVRSGEVSARKAEVVLPAARGDAEPLWVARTKTDTVRALAAAVREERGAAAAGSEDERWERISLPLTPAARAKLDEAMTLAGKVLGGDPPKWQRLEAICQEYVGAHPPEAEEDERDVLLRTPADASLEAAKAGLEEEMGRWSFLEKLAPVAAPPGPTDEEGTDPLRLDAELRELAALRDRWDEVLGHAALLLRSASLWRDLGFASFGHYCEERLGMAGSTVAQRAYVAGRFYTLPSLREALRERRLSYEGVRLLARLPDDETARAWIARAEGMTCLALKRALEDEEDRQMCARGELDLRVPEAVADVVETAVRAARRAEGRWISVSECVERIADHFTATWKEVLKQRMTLSRKVRERDRNRCLVPGCSRASGHAHHTQPKARGGPTVLENLGGLCPPHHLHGGHYGYIQVTGKAPDALRWELAAPPDSPLLALPTPWPPPPLLD
jgi:hypothetical protein